jgi:hypothetical protein
VIVTKITIGFAVALYIFLWILFFNGASELLTLLVIPLVLVLLIGLGSWMTRAIGLPTKAPQFRKPEPDDEQ